MTDECRVHHSFEVRKPQDRLMVKCDLDALAL